VVSGAVAMLVPGALGGLAAGIACQRYFAALLFETESHDPRIIGLTLAVTIAVALAAAFPAVSRALHVDPSAMLRTD